MAQLSRRQIAEVVFWIGFAVLAYAFSFDFDREIEIYRFGASSWPRVVAVLIALAALCQLIQSLREGGKTPGPGAAQMAEAAPERRLGDTLRITAVLGLPVLYAALLDVSGFYFTTPIFIAAYLWLNGERRLPWLIGVPVFIYAFLLTVFTKLLYIGLPVGYVRPFYDFSNWLLVLIK
jgi:hypothetical protein